MLFFLGIVDSPLMVKIILFFLITLAVFTAGLTIERLAIIAFHDKSSHDFDKEFNSGEMLDVIFNKLNGKAKIQAYNARIFFVGMKELTQSNIRNVDFSMPYADEIKKGIRDRMLSITSIEKNQIAIEMKDGVAFLITIALIAPLIGFAGTLYGLMANIYDFKITSIDAVHSVHVLYSSLVSTIFGIIISIIAIIGYNMIISKINTDTLRHEIFGITVANMLARELDFITTNAHQRKGIK
jgi:biopolymer transport protein TolQ